METSGQLLISRTNLLHNVTLLHGRARVPLLAVIKANAYGHGASLVSEVLESAWQVWGYGVATPQEAVELRQWGRQKPVLLLAPAVRQAAVELAQLGVRLSVGRPQDLEGLPPGTIVHLEVDTGLHRYGCPVGDLPALYTRARQAGLQVEGVFSHLAGPFADGTGSHQARQFYAATDHLSPGLLRHLYCTESILEYGPDPRQQLVRPGIGLFGAVERLELGLLPVGLLRGRVALVHEISAGTAVSYDASWIAPRNSRLAVIQVGYADGYPLQAEYKAMVWLGQKYCPVVGYFGMDALWVDITEVTQPLGEWAELVGPHLHPSTVAAWARSIPAHLLPGFSQRLQRILVN